MNKWIRISLIAAGIWLGSFVASLLLILIGAAISQKRGIFSAEVVVVILLVITVIFFITGIIFVHKTAKRILAKQRTVWIFALFYSGSVVIALLIIGLITMIALNR